MFQICVHDQKVQGKEPTLRNVMLRRSKDTIFLVLLKSQNLWNLINFLINIFLKYYFSASYYFLKFDESKTSRCDIFNGTTQGCVQPYPMVIISCPHSQSCQRQVIAKTTIMLTT